MPMHAHLPTGAASSPDTPAPGRDRRAPGAACSSLLCDMDIKGEWAASICSFLGDESEHRPGCKAEVPRLWTANSCLRHWPGGPAQRNTSQTVFFPLTDSKVNRPLLLPRRQILQGHGESGEPSDYGEPAPSAGKGRAALGPCCQDSAGSPRAPSSMAVMHICCGAGCKTSHPGTGVRSGGKKKKKNKGPDWQGKGKGDEDTGGRMIAQRREGARCCHQCGR